VNADVRRRGVGAGERLSYDRPLCTHDRSGGSNSIAEGQQVQVELLGADDGSEVALTPVMFVDGDTVLATPRTSKA
jgi:hypothetical protein